MAKKKKPADPAPAKRPCFVCNGTGIFCDLCGEAVNVCHCEDDGGGSVHDCEDCRGTGIAAADVCPDCEFDVGEHVPDDYPALDAGELFP